MKSIIAVLIILMFKCPLVDQPKAQDFSGWWIYGDSLHLFKDEKSLKEFEVSFLNERKEDIPTLVKHFFQKSSEELAEEKKYLSAEVEDYFMTLSWPGNVRQLENTCRWLTVMSPTREVKLEDLPDDLKVENIENMNDWTKVLQSWSENYLAKGNNNLLEEAIPNFERTIIKVALNKTMGRKKEAAELLGWGRNTLTRKIKELGLDS